MQRLLRRHIRCTESVNRPETTGEDPDRHNLLECYALHFRPWYRSSELLEQIRWITCVNFLKDPASSGRPPVAARITLQRHSCRTDERTFSCSVQPQVAACWPVLKSARPWWTFTYSRPFTQRQVLPTESRKSMTNKERTLPVATAWNLQ